MATCEIRAIIFDNDGTLVDSESISLRVLIDLVAEQGLVIPHAEAMANWAGRDLNETLPEIETRLGRKLPDDFLTTFRAEQMARLETEVQPVDGATELLAAIDKPFCVASNAPREKMQLCLEKTGLLKFIDEGLLFSAYDIQAWKPKPDLFLHAAEKLGTEPRHCAVVEDSQFGIDAGIAAGMQVFAFDPHHRFPTNGAFRVVNRLHELLPLLAENDA